MPSLGFKFWKSFGFGTSLGFRVEGQFRFLGSGSYFSASDRGF